MTCINTFFLLPLSHSFVCLALWSVSLCCLCLTLLSVLLCGLSHSVVCLALLPLAHSVVCLALLSVSLCCICLGLAVCLSLSVCVCMSLFLLCYWGTECESHSLLLLLLLFQLVWNCREDKTKKQKNKNKKDVDHYSMWLEWNSPKCNLCLCWRCALVRFTIFSEMHPRMQWKLNSIHRYGCTYISERVCWDLISALFGESMGPEQSVTWAVCDLSSLWPEQSVTWAVCDLSSYCVTAK